MDNQNTLQTPSAVNTPTKVVSANVPQGTEVSNIVNTNIVYASFFRRLAASLVDGFILSIIMFTISFVTGLLSALISGADPTQPNSAASMLNGIMSMFSSLISFIYYIYFIGSKGQTLGKMALSIKVVKIEDKGTPGYLKAFLREVVGKTISALVFGLGFFWMIWDKNKQTWADKIAGTIVLRVEKNA